MQCVCPCHDELFESKELIEEMYANIRNCRIPTELILHCPKCGRELEPWVRGFTFLEGKNIERNTRSGIVSCWNIKIKRCFITKGTKRKGNYNKGRYCRCFGVCSRKEITPCQIGKVMLVYYSLGHQSDGSQTE